MRASAGFARLDSVDAKTLERVLAVNASGTILCAREPCAACRQNMAAREEQSAEEVAEAVARPLYDKCILYYRFYCGSRRRKLIEEKKRGVACPHKDVERKEFAIAGKRSTKLALYSLNSFPGFRTILSSQ